MTIVIYNKYMDGTYHAIHCDRRWHETNDVRVVFFFKLILYSQRQRTFLSGVNNCPCHVLICIPKCNTNVKNIVPLASVEVAMRECHNSGDKNYVNIVCSDSRVGRLGTRTRMEITLTPYCRNYVVASRSFVTK